MSGGIEAAGDVIAGGLIARAVEPGAGEDTTGSEARCLNCGGALAGKYCHECGQSAHVHRTLGAFWHDFTHSILHFEGKIWRTLPLLFFKPGQLTRRYVGGERARFISPLALFLFSVFLMFATFNLVGPPFGSPASAKNEGVLTEKAELKAELLKAEARVAALEKAGVTGKTLQSAREDLAALKLGARFVGGDIPKSIDIDPDQVLTGSPAVDKAVREAAKDPKLLFYKMQSNAYKFSWALIPLSIPFVWLLFIFRRQYKAYDHAIFVTYSLCFMGLLLVLLSLLGKVPVLQEVHGPILALAPPVHMFAQLRGAYDIGVFAAVWRTMALIGIAFGALLMFGVMLLLLGVSG